MSTDTILAAETFVRTQLEKEGSGHDWWHIERVRNIASRIAKTETADPFIVDLTVLLHDIGDSKVLNTEEDDLTLARDFLTAHKVEKVTAEHILHIIEHMSFSKEVSATNSAKKSIEFQVVQDADRLDSIGAIGIARAFAFGGSRGRLIYDPTREAQHSYQSASERRQSTSDTLHHFDEKLFLLKNMMNTQTGKELAAARHAYMEDFYKRFLAEWKGKQ